MASGQSTEPGDRAVSWAVTVSTRYAGRTAILDFQGRFTLGPAVNEIETRVAAALTAKSATGLVLNFAAVSAIDSAGVGELMKVRTMTMQRGVRMALADANPKVIEVLKITRLNGLLKVCPDEASALQHVAKP